MALNLNPLRLFGFDRKGHKSSQIKKRWVKNSLSIILVILAFVVFSGTFFAYRYYHTSLKEHLLSKAESNSRFLNKYVNKNYDEFYIGSKRMVNEFLDKGKLELQITSTEGNLIYSSNGYSFDVIKKTPDIKECLNVKRASVYTGSIFKNQDRIISVSAPLYLADGTAVGVLRYVSGLSEVYKNTAFAFFIMLLLVFIILLLIYYSNRYFLKTIVTSINEINQTTAKIAKGYYGIKINKEFNDEIGELCDTINYMSEEISKAEAIKNEFISSISHELRTPLTAIKGWSETLYNSQSEHSALSEKGFGIIKEETTRLQKMLEELLDFSRMQSGSFKLSMTPTNIIEEIDEAISLYTQTFEQEGVRLLFENSCLGEVPLMCDKSRMRQIIINILDNALKYAKSGLLVEVFAIESDTDFILKVKDYGEGISEQDLPYVRQKFYRANQKIKGSGLGLAICDELIRLQGGTIDIENAPDAGVLVTLTMPKITQ